MQLHAIDPMNRPTSSATKGRASDEASTHFDQFGIRKKYRDLKTRWGIYYTPDELIRSLCRCMIRHQNEIILEPSFGGCGFLRASVERLAELGCSRAWDNLWGADIDQRAFEHLPGAVDPTGTHFIKVNFLETDTNSFGGRQFDIVLGNPPYVSRHNMWDYQKESALDVLRTTEATVSSRASLWVYFVLHATRFIKPGGRMAWVLPRSLTEAFYGKQLLKYVAERFSSIFVISLSSRHFIAAGADEATDVLICEGKRAAAGNAVPVAFKTMAVFDTAFRETEQNAKNSSDAALPARASQLSLSTQTHFANLARQTFSRKLGTLCDVRIGIVTGASRFFLSKKSELKKRGLILRDTAPLLTSFGYCTGLDWTEQDEKDIVARDGRVLLLRSSQNRRSQRVRTYIGSFPAELRDAIKTFGKRPIWFAPDDHAIPDAFFPTLVGEFPWLVLNARQTNSNNNLHRLYFKDSGQLYIYLAAISLISTFGQLSAELNGRVCGGTGLKFEPSNCREIDLLLPETTPEEVASTFALLNTLIRENRADDARKAADAFFADRLGELYATNLVELFARSLQKLRNHRFGTPE